MIGYRITEEELKKSIDDFASTWSQRAADRTAIFAEQGFYREDSTIWSEVKQIYMILQGGSKCIYCESKMEAVDLGAVAHDVEHFRPKGNIKPWKLSKSLKSEGIALAEPPADKGGYYLLTYHIFNYAASCKPCNSVLKRDYFPVASHHDVTQSHPKSLLDEQPLLIYPIGDFDDSPEELIEFFGISPRPRFASGYKRHRALVTIEFFKLDNQAKRKNLIRDRAIAIIALYPQLEAISNGATGRRLEIANKIVEGFTSPSTAHTNCSRCFRKTYEADPAKAAEIFEKAADLVSSIS